MPIKLNTENIRAIALFEKITKVHAKDCIMTENCVYFLVNPTKIGFAIGKNGANVKEVRKALDKPVKLFGFDKDPESFVKNIVPNTKSVEISNGSMIITVSPKDKTTAIGKNGSNIKIIKELMGRYFDIKYVKLR